MRCSAAVIPVWQAHTEHKLNQALGEYYSCQIDFDAASAAQDLNAGMNRGAAENNGIERPPWYTKEWPKDRTIAIRAAPHTMDASQHDPQMQKTCGVTGRAWSRHTHARRQG